MSMSDCTSIASTTTSLAKIKSLLEKGNGLLSSLYLLRIRLSSDNKPFPLKNQEFQKVRAKVEKAFPNELPDLAKVQGGDLFYQKAPEIKAALEEVVGIIMSVYEFSSNSQGLLLSVPKDLQELPLEYTRLLVISYFDLLVSYMRVWMMLASVPYKFDS